jgi:hypothetical protein
VPGKSEEIGAYAWTLIRMCGADCAPSSGTEMP